MKTTTSCLSVALLGLTLGSTGLRAQCVTPPFQLSGNDHQLTVTIPGPSGSPDLTVSFPDQPGGFQLSGIEPEGGLVLSFPSGGGASISAAQLDVMLVLNARILPVSMDPLPGRPASYVLRLPSGGKLGLSRLPAGGTGPRYKAAITGPGGTLAPRPITPQQPVRPRN